MDWKDSPGRPLTRGEIHGPEIQAAIILIKGVSKPIFFKTANKKECLTLSKAFAKSSFNTNPFSCLDRLEWMDS